MPSVRVRENEPFEVALRRFKRTIEKTGLLTELRAREFYEKPTVRAQAQEGRRGEAPLQAHPQPATAAQALLKARSTGIPIGGAKRFAPLAVFATRKPAIGSPA